MTKTSLSSLSLSVSLRGLAFTRLQARRRIFCERAGGLRVFATDFTDCTDKTYVLFSVEGHRWHSQLNQEPIGVRAWVCLASNRQLEYRVNP
jgi:hypothetical protein